MKNKIYRDLSIIVFISLFTSLIFQLVFFESEIKDSKESSLHDILISIDSISNGQTDKALETINNYKNVDNTVNFVLANPQGIEIYNSGINIFSTTLKDSKEFKEANESGYGENKYRENLLGSCTYNISHRLDDGNILIASQKSDILPDTLKKSVLFLIALAILVSIILKKSVDKQLTNLFEIIEKIAIDENAIENQAIVLDTNFYEGIAPFEKIIREKNRAIDKYVNEVKNRTFTIEFILDNMKEGMIFLDNDLRVLSSNSAGKILFVNKRPINYQGCYFIELNRDLDLYNALLDAREKNESKRITFEISGILLSVYITPISGNESIKGMLIFIVDEDEKLKAEKRRRDFTANVSHELKSPLTSINGYAELIENNLVKPEDTTKFARTIRLEGQRLLELIDNIIQLSKLDEASDDLELQLVNVEELFKEVVSQNEYKIKEKNIDVKISVEKGTLVKANRNLLGELITNLVTNAIKYNKDNGKINLISYKEDNKTKMIVEDTGIGIAEKYKERVFERFFVVDKSRSSQESTGLGLSIVKHIVELHHGKLELESKLNEGTRITVTI
ncbi:MAG: HAMP domain-containing sensor histidine kinase [Finegoldia sp.]|nr:HAMP domain-containing sensor histidine kinase [Finegoldia sp.]